MSTTLIGGRKHEGSLLAVFSSLRWWFINWRVP